MDNILDMEDSFREKILIDQIEKLKNENTRLKILLQEAGIEDKSGEITTEEIICVRQLERLNEISEDKELDKDQVKSFDLLVKNLKLIRGENTRVGRKNKIKEMTTEELMKELNK